MLFEGLYHPPNMTPDGMRERGGEREGKRWTLRGSHQYTLMINFDWVFGT